MKMARNCRSDRLTQEKAEMLCGQASPADVNQRGTLAVVPGGQFSPAGPPDVELSVPASNPRNPSTCTNQGQPA